MEPLFVFDNGHYVPTPWSRGPWNPALLHGGPPAALLAHVVEEARDDPALLTTRLTVDLLRPVGFTPIRTSTQVVRSGRRIRLVDAFLHQDGVLVARASGLMLRRDPGAPAFPTLPPTLPTWEGLPLDNFHSDGSPSFNQGTQCCYVRDPLTGRVRAVWICVDFDLLPGRALTPLEYAAGISDYTNAVGSIATFGRAGFINADITLNLHREPAGKWLCLESPGRPSRDGVATSSVLLHDTQGLVGSAAVCCLANPIPRRPDGTPAFTVLE